MTLRELIRASYQERVALAPIPNELRSALAAHERIPKFFDNLERELAVLPSRYRDQMTVKEAVYSLTDVFIMNLRRVADERQLSDLARNAEIVARTEAAKREELADRILAGDAVDLSEVL